MNQRLHDALHLRAVAAGAQATPLADGLDDEEGPSFLPPMRRRSRRDRQAPFSAPRAAAAAPQAAPAPVAPRPQPGAVHRKAEPQRPPPVARPAAAAHSGWMTDAEQLAAAAAPAVQPELGRHFTRPGPLGPAGHPGHAGPAFRPPPPARWLRSGFPWLAPRGLALLAGVVVLIALGGALAALLGGPATPVVSAAPAARNQMRQLLGQLEECRGIESLLVMLPSGPERDATLVRLQRQHQQIDTWLNDNSAWLSASHGAQATADLRDANAAWRALQQRVVQAEVLPGRTGLANESRQLLTGPSAAAYRRVVLLVEGLAQRQPG